MISSSTSCCPPGSESSTGSDSWTLSKAEVACTLTRTLKHTHSQAPVVVLTITETESGCILTYIVVYRRVLHSYHTPVGWSHQSDRERHHQTSLTSETLLQRQKISSQEIVEFFFIICLCEYAFGFLTWSMSNVLDTWVHQMFLPVVDVRTDDDNQHIHHIEAQIPYKEEMR